jgi:hypothetical protein
VRQFSRFAPQWVIPPSAIKIKALTPRVIV